MSQTTKVLIVLAVLAAGGLVLYFATKEDGILATTAAGTGPASGAAGVVRSIGAGLTGLVAAITGAVETSQLESGKTEPEGEP